MCVEKIVKWWVFPLMSASAVFAMGLGYFLFLTPFEWCGLFFSYAAVGCALCLAALSFAATLFVTAWLVWRGRYGRAVCVLSSYLAVYLVAFVVARCALVLWVRAETGG